MSTIQNFEEKSHKLREQAEERLALPDNNVVSPFASFTERRQLHELQVQQIELEMQNGQLLETLQVNEELLAQYKSLYTFNSPEMLNLIIDAMQDLILWKDLSGVYKGCNLAFAEVGCGSVREEVIGKTDGHFIANSALLDSYLKEDAEVIASGVGTRSENWFTLPSGARRCFDTLKKPLLSHTSEIIGILVVARDITEPRLLRDKVINSNSKYKSLFHNMSEGFALHEVVYDEMANVCDFRFMEVNSAFERITGLKNSEIIGKKLSELPLIDDLQITAVYNRLVLSGDPERFTRYSSINKRHYFIYAFSPGPDRFAMLFHDKTDRIIAEEALQVSQLRMKEAQRIAKLGNWEFNHETGSTICSDEIYRILELNPVYPITLDNLLPLIHPDDREKYEQIRQEPKPDAQPHSLSLRLLLPSGDVKYLHIHWETDFDQSGNRRKSAGTMQDITDRTVLRKELEYYKKQELEGHSFQNILTVNSEMKNVLNLAAIVVKSPLTTVFINGESGCGKGLLAKAIHSANKNVTGRFVTVNCAAIPDNLLESELFGHKRGAFTGAESDREGKFHWARGGTIFLDEIGDMSFTLQAKLLRILEDRTFEKVGSDRSEKVDCRIIVATNRNLNEMVLEGKFREDLFHRITVFPLTIPPLRNRMEDLPALCDYMLKTIGTQLGRKKVGITGRAMQLLLAYHWPGNVRELRNCLERALLISGDDEIDTQQIVLNNGTVSPETVQSVSSGTTHYNLCVSTDDLSLKALDEQIIAITLDRCEGNKTMAAKILKIGRSAFYYASK